LQRVDKFLWFARFYKSRTLAAAMVSDGRVRVNGTRCEKPSANVKLGDVLTFPAGARIKVIKVTAIGERRGPASEAQKLYEDLTPVEPKPPEEASAAPREKGSGRPTKRDRRAISAFTRGDGD
jgi:ribosome-associated heat shock protein Hsp15